MLRSLFAGISGLRVNQTMLDVTGNNIANANTIGFKSSTTVFQDTLSQMLTASSAASDTRGGTNPIQIGLGVQVAATSGNFTQGSTETTGGETDMMINGDGFFVVQDGSTDTYTRAGAFHWDSDGNLCAADGKFVMGYEAAEDADGSYSAVTTPADTALKRINLNMDGGTDPTSYEIGSDGAIRVTDENGDQRTVGYVAIANFVNPQGLDKVGDTQFAASANSGDPEIGVAATEGRGNLTVGALEMSNVDLAAEFTNLILAQRGFEASSKVITTSDSVLEDLVNMKR